MASSSGRGRRAVAAWNAAVSRASGVAPKSLIIRSAKAARRLDVRDVVQHVECLERRIRPRFSRTMQVSRPGASNATMAGGGTVRFQNV